MRPPDPTRGPGPIPWSLAQATRWVLAFGISAAVVYGSEAPVRPWPHYTFVVAVLAGNGLLAWFWRRFESTAALRFVVAADVVAVTVTIGLTGRSSADLYLFYFVVLLAAATADSWRAFVLATVATCTLYGGLLYADLGPPLWRDTALLLRVPFLLAVSLFLGLAAQRVRWERETSDRMARALAEIGELGVSWGSTGQVLYRIAHCIQETLGVDRCSLILIEEGFRSGYLAASGDDPSIETRLLPLDKYPEIEAALENNDILELHPDNPKELWDKVRAHLPETSSFRSFLIVPVSLRGDLLGVYFLRSHQPNRHFDLRERTFCQVVAMLTATFIHERELQRELATGSRRPTAVPVAVS